MNSGRELERLEQIMKRLRGRTVVPGIASKPTPVFALA